MKNNIPNDGRPYQKYNLKLSIKTGRIKKILKKLKRLIT